MDRKKHNLIITVLNLALSGLLVWLVFVHITASGSGNNFRTRGLEQQVTVLKSQNQALTVRLAELSSLVRIEQLAQEQGLLPLAVKGYLEGGSNVALR